ncbi:hypothetical protein H4219_003011 [Mycoemilia scoparia]|uniref:Uncharacterized protein n=1 Tax=Mycoemilia scoparia TaxID=417184 RepID=A0A9W8A1R1_9FUNG|nr:hypothetical protein H4219_003011 [Mycoemilia scoparia]
MKYATASILSVALLSVLAGHKEANARVVGVVVGESDPEAAKSQAQSLLSKNWKDKFAPVYKEILGSLSANDKKAYDAFSAGDVPETYNPEWASKLFEKGFNKYLYSNPGGSETLQAIDADGDLNAIPTKVQEVFATATNDDEFRELFSKSPSLFVNAGDDDKSTSASGSESDDDKSKSSSVSGSDSESKKSSKSDSKDSDDDESSDTTGAAGSSNIISTHQFIGLAAAVIVGAASLI